MFRRLGKIAAVVLATAAIVIVIGILANFHLAKVLWGNWFPPKVTLHVDEQWDGGKTYERVPYANLSAAQYLDLYVPEMDKPMPLLIIIHGGGFYFGDSQTRQAQLMYQYFRDHGYACASVHYRLSSEAGFPAAVEDVKAAVRFLRANADQYGYDSERFATWGESAGGYLSAMAAMTNDDEFSGVPFIGEEELKETVSGKIQVMTEFYGVEELGAIDRDWDQLGIPKWIRAIGNLWLSDVKKEFDGQYNSCEAVFLRSNLEDLSEDELEKTSPTHYLIENFSEENRIPVLIWHGDADITVPFLESERFAAFCKGVMGKEDVTYKLFPGYGHASDGFYTDLNLAELKDFLDENLS